MKVVTLSALYAVPDGVSRRRAAAGCVRRSAARLGGWRLPQSTDSGRVGWMDGWICHPDRSGIRRAVRTVH